MPMYHIVFLKHIRPSLLVLEVSLTYYFLGYHGLPVIFMHHETAPTNLKYLELYHTKILILKNF